MTDTPGTCLPFEEDLSALLDGELEPDREAAVRTHLAACVGCNTRLAEMAAVNEQLRQLAASPVPVDLEARLLARVAGDEAAGAPAETPARSRPRRRPRLVPALAAAALAAAGAALVYWGALERPLPLEPAPRIAQQQAPRRPAPLPEADLDVVSDEDLSVGLDLDTLEDLEVIANLDLLEDLDAAGGTDQG